MRIFERLRRRARSDQLMLCKLFETITSDLLEKLEDEAAATILPSGESAGSPCCAVVEVPRR